MKIFAGTARGRFVNAPKGANLRPTTDKTRLALFNAIGALVPDSIFLDLFCGTGSIGLEALSRGARKVMFVDSQKICIDGVKKTADDFGFNKDSWEAWCSDYQRGLNTLATRGVKLDLVFVDPPYDGGLNKPPLQALVKLGLLASHDRMRVILEHRSELEPPQVDGLSIYRRYDHGAASVAIYGPEGEPLAG